MAKSSKLNKNPRRRRNGLRAVTPPSAPQRDTLTSGRRQGVKLLPLLGLGALGLVAAALLRKPGPPGTRRASRQVDDRAKRDVAEQPPSQGSAFEPSPDDDLQWIAGPSGNLRFLERHPEGKLHLIFLHGLGGRLEHWLPLLDCTGPGIHGVALDLPGHGESELEAGEDGATVEAMAHAVVATLDLLGLRRAILVGHDLGAAVAVEVASQQPGRLQGLFLVDPNGDQSRLDASSKEQVLAAMQNDPRDEVRWQFQQILMDAQPRVADRVLADLAISRQEALYGAVRSCLDFPVTERLRQFDGPCKVLVSDLNDVPYSLHRLMPELPSSVLPQASHWLMMDAPEPVWESLVDLLDWVVTS